ncbi:MAG: asparagine synthase-related protein [Chloroflexota bacterium]
MSGIAGIAHTGKQADVKRMLEKIAHRGVAADVIETDAVTLGCTWPKAQSVTAKHLKHSSTAYDSPGDGHFVLVRGNDFLIKRGALGVAPLYYGWTDDGLLCFASEVKGLLEFTRNVHELPPGHVFDGQELEAYSRLGKLPVLQDPPEAMVKELRRRLEVAVEKRLGAGEVGSWLSGGLDSSALAALARPHFAVFHTFTAGLPGAPDVVNAQVVAEAIWSEHHVRTVRPKDLLAVLPEVIYHLESFDAWLVRSSVMNYLVAQMAADYVPAVFSGEGGDELFAGYEYLKTLDPAQLPDELVDISSRLHNTALQRVDRCAAAHGSVAHVAFLDPNVVDYALRIPAEYKLHQGVEKWILRQAVADVLPDSIVNRPKAKFWQGAGVEELLAEHADAQISDADFARQRRLSNGWVLNTKEELLYYRIFQEHFGAFENLGWMGRTKGAAVQ